MHRLPILLLFFCLLAHVRPAAAQQPDAVQAAITKQLGLTDTVSTEPALFLQLDKQLYAVTDDIWFTAWWLQGATTAQGHTLYLLLVNDMTATPVTVGSFVLQQGVSSGHFPIPDTLEAGEYSLMAYTNTFLEGRGWAVRKPVQILGARKPPFKLKLSGQVLSSGSGQITARITTSTGGLATGAVLHGTLYQGGQFLQHWKGRADAFGELTLKLPGLQTAAPYELRGVLIKATDTMHFKQAVTNLSLPATVLPGSGTGFHCSLPQATIKDTLLVDIAVPEANSRCWLVVSDHRNIHYSLQLALPKRKGQLRLPTTGWSTGEVLVSLFDDKGGLEQQAKASIQKSEPVTLTLRADSVRYQPRSPVKLQISLRDAQGQPVKAAMALSVVLAKTQSWPGVHMIPADTITWPSPLSGRVTYGNKELKKPAQLILVASPPVLLPTDAKGYFQLPPEAARGPAQSKLLLSVTTKDPIGYALWMDSSVNRLHRSLAARYYPLSPQAGETVLSEEEKENIRTAPGQLLEQVVVTAKARDDKNYYGVQNTNGYCDDYVCGLGFLNCQVHPKGSEGTRMPVEGQTYVLEGFGTKREVIYHCPFADGRSHIRLLAATAYAAPFVGYDGTSDAAPHILQGTTLYWSSAIVTNEQGEANVSFFTNDRAGKFVIRVQGVHPDGLFCGAGEIIVNR